MTHTEPTTYAAFQSVGGNSSADVLSAAIEEGETFELEEVEVKAVSDPAGDVEVRVFTGDRPVAPQNGVATMANDDLTLAAGETYDTGDTVRVNVSKTTTGSIEVSVLARGTIRK